MSFGADMKRFAAKTDEKMQRAVRQIVYDAFSEVILISPVDTGRFRGNWLPAIGSAPTGTIDATDPTGAATVAKVSGVVAGMNLGDVIYLANNLPYAARLEDGYSNQAPAGMVRLTQQRFQPIANAVIKQIGRE